MDLILFTHATNSHLGAFAYLYKIAPELFEHIPIYATLPVINMGRMVTLDSYRSIGLLGPILDSQITVSDIENAFDRINSLKYSQPFNLTGKLERMTITAFNAGHSLGGTIWRIQKDHESIVFADDWNHARDSHLSGAFLQPNGKVIEALSRPTAMICGTKISDSIKDRKEALYKDIQDTITRGGTVLIPTSSGCRVLELCHILESYWRVNNLTIPLVYYSHVGNRTMSYASSMLEWMSSNIIDEWQVHNDSPFDIKHLKVITDLAELSKMDGPKVVLAAGESMEIGFARTIFASVCGNDVSSVILTERPGYGTLSDMLYKIWKSERGPNDDSSHSNIQLTTRVTLSYGVEQKLEGEELEEFNEMIQSEKDQQSQQEKQALMDLRSKNILEQEQDDEESSDDSEDEDELVGKMDLEVLVYKNNNIYDYDVRGSAGKNRMFPFTNKRRRNDDYGEVIKVEDYMKANENKSEQAKIDDPAGKIGESSRSKWAQVAYGGETLKLDRTSDNAVPVKITKVEEDLKVLCSVDFIDFEGLTNERSMNMIIPEIKPKKLIFLPSDATFSVSESFYDTISQNEDGGGIEEIIRAPPNQFVGGTMTNYPFSVRVASELESLLRWQKILGDYSVAHITGKLVFEEEEEEGKENAENKNNEDGKGTDADGDVEIKETNGSTEEDDIAKEYGRLNKKIKMVPLETAKELAAAPRSNPLLVGDIKLAELKKKLISQGHKAEFRAEGILVCDDKVAVRKIGEGRLTIEGGVNAEFYETKDVVRNLLAIV